MVESVVNEFYDLDHLLTRNSKFATKDFEANDQVCKYYIILIIIWNYLVKGLDDLMRKNFSHRY